MEAPIKVIFAGISSDLAEDLMRVLRASGFAPVSRDVNSTTALVDAFDIDNWDAILVDGNRRHLTPARIGEILKNRGDETPLIVLCDGLDSRRAIELIKVGAADVLRKSEKDRLPACLKREIKAARKRWQERFAEDETRVAATAFNTAAEGMMVTDRTGRVIAINPAFTKLTGHVLSAALGCSPEIFYAEHHTQSFFAAQQAELNESGTWKGEAWFRHSDGRRFAVWLSTTAVTNSKGEVTEYVSTFRDITERKEREDRFRRQATYDPLTELPNRILFFDRLDQTIRSASRKEKTASLLYVDLDHFKNVNDTFGHATGDKLLKQVAERLQDCARDCDTVARIGGDEFAIVLEDDWDGTAAVRVATNAINALSRAFDLDNNMASIGCSIGIAMFPQDGDGCNDLLSKSDAAMYEAKNAGKGRYHFFEPSTPTVGATQERSASRFPTLVGIVATLALIAWAAASGVISEWVSPNSNIIAQDPAVKELNNFDTAAGAPSNLPRRR